jgi:hypothetical protein
MIREGVRAGERLTIPAEVPADFAKIIEACWAQRPEQRPTFSDVVQMIKRAMPSAATIRAAVSSAASTNRLLRAHLLRRLLLSLPHLPRLPHLLP